MSQACGVDFGTSNSTVGWHRGAQSVLLALEQDKLTLPSVIFFNAEEHEVSYGRAALANYLAGYEGRLMRSMKSLLGTSLIDGQTEVMGKPLAFRDLLSQFIGELKKRAEQSAGQAFEHAVFGRPSISSTITARLIRSPRTRWKILPMRLVSKKYIFSLNLSRPPSIMSRA
jgi:hypothetical chaperone protein